jgi:hypothetical protein
MRQIFIGARLKEKLNKNKVKELLIKIFSLISAFFGLFVKVLLNT